MTISLQPHAKTPPQIQFCRLKICPLAWYVQFLLKISLDFFTLKNRSKSELQDLTLISACQPVIPPMAVDIDFLFSCCSKISLPQVQNGVPSVGRRTSRRSSRMSANLTTASMAATGETIAGKRILGYTPTPGSSERTR
jgi:hypothetical protein